MNDWRFHRVSALALLMAATGGAAVDTNVVSVRVMGADFGGRNTVAAWCHTEVEPVLARLENDWPHGAPVLLVRLQESARAAPRIERFSSPATTGGGMGTVAVSGWVNANGEELLEACVGAALNAGLRCPVPDWFAVGLAQGGHPGCRARNRLLRRAAPASVTPSLEMLFSWAQLPEENPLKRAWCAEVALFVTDHGNAATRALLQRLAEGAPVKALDLASDLNLSAPRFERQWRDWLAQREQVFQEMGGLTPDAVDGLRARLPARPAPDATPVMPRDFLRPAANTESARRAAAWQASSLRRFQAGQDPALAAVAEAYAFYYEGLARNRWRWRLRHRLEAADRALNELERLTVERTRWLDAIDSQAENAGDQDGIPGLVVEKSRLREYIDRIERETTASEIAHPAVP